MMRRFRVPQQRSAPAEWVAGALREINAGTRGSHRAILNAQLLLIGTGKAESLSDS
jgi:hypothetical protein